MVQEEAKKKPHNNSTHTFEKMFMKAHEITHRNTRVPWYSPHALNVSGKTCISNHDCIAPGSNIRLQNISPFGLQLNNNSTV